MSQEKIMTEPSKHAIDAAERIMAALENQRLGIAWYPTVENLTKIIDAATAELREEVERLKIIIAERNAVVKEQARLNEFTSSASDSRDTHQFGAHIADDDGRTSAKFD